MWIARGINFGDLLDDLGFACTIVFDFTLLGGEFARLGSKFWKLPVCLVGKVVLVGVLTSFRLVKVKGVYYWSFASVGVACQLVIRRLGSSFRIADSMWLHRICSFWPRDDVRRFRARCTAEEDCGTHPMTPDRASSSLSCIQKLQRPDLRNNRRGNGCHLGSRHELQKIS